VNISTAALGRREIKNIVISYRYLLRKNKATVSNFISYGNNEYLSGADNSNLKSFRLDGLSLPNSTDINK
jgi:hypothetical protein